MVSWLMKCKIVKFRKFCQPEIPLDTFIPIRQYTGLNFQIIIAKKKKNKKTKQSKVKYNHFARAPLFYMKYHKFLLSSIVNFTKYMIDFLCSNQMMAS